MFGSACDRKVAAAREALLAQAAGDLLCITPAQIVATGISLAPRQRRALVRRLLADAIHADCDRLIQALHAFGRENVPPARLAGDWAASLGADSHCLAEVLRTADGPVNLAQEYLRVGRIGLAEANALADVAAAYGAGRDLALVWIGQAIEHEIDHYAELARDRKADSWLRQIFRRACALNARSQPR
jgi:hypothetical protein